MNIKAGTTININFTLDRPASEYKYIYAAAYTDDTNHTFENYFKKTCHCLEIKSACTNIIDKYVLHFN